jgi:hypothetical protein
LSIDSPSLCQSIGALQKPWPEKEKDRQTNLYCILCARAEGFYSYDFKVFSPEEQKRPIKNGKKFSFWPKLSIKYRKPIESQLGGYCERD